MSMQDTVDKAYRDTARGLYGSDGEVEIDSDALVSYGDDPGAYVQAWVWVPSESVVAAEVAA